MWKRFRNSMEWKYLSNIGLEHISEKIYCIGHNISDCYWPSALGSFLKHIFNFYKFWFKTQILYDISFKSTKKPLAQIVTCFPPRPWHLAHYFPNQFQWAFFDEENYYVCLSHRRFKLNLYYRAYINLCKYVFHKFYCAIQCF